MSMQTQRSLPIKVQMELFQRPPSRPRWEQLPADLRGAVVKLLAQMLLVEANRNQLASREREEDRHE